MGTWIIQIEGHGAHHNKDLMYDANEQALSFVSKLQETGHKITRAEFTCTASQSDDLLTNTIINKF